MRVYAHRLRRKLDDDDGRDPADGARYRLSADERDSFTWPFGVPREWGATVVPLRKPPWCRSTNGGWGSVDHFSSFANASLSWEHIRLPGAQEAKLGALVSAG